MCDRAHDKSCPFCDRLKNTLKEIELNLSEANLDEEYRDDVMYFVSANLYSNRSLEGSSTEIYSTGQGPFKHHRYPGGKLSINYSRLGDEILTPKVPGNPSRLVY